MTNSPPSAIDRSSAVSLAMEAVTANRDCLVLGAPGTGKTEFVLDLVSQLESGGLEPTDVLVLTPQRSQASNLRDRLALGSNQVSTGPRARSVTSLAFEILKGQIPDVRLLSGPAQQQLISELVLEAEKESKSRSWGIDPQAFALSGFHAELRDLFTVLVENHVSAEDLSEFQTKWPSGAWQVAIDLFPKYLERLKDTNQVDAAQLIVQATKHVNKFPTPKIIVVDDAQDLSLTGLWLVSKLQSGGALVLVGDPDVATLGFRSAAGMFVDFFRKNQAGGLEITLDPLLCQPAAVQQLMARIVQRIPTSLALNHRPKTQEAKAEAEFAVFDNRISEADFLAGQLRATRVRDSLNWSDMAVIARTRAQLDQLAGDLASRSIPVRILGSQRPLREQPAARAVLDFGQLVFQGSDHQLVLELLGSRLVGLNAIQQRRLFRQLAQEERFQNQTRSQLLEGLFEEPVELDTPEVRSLNRAIDLVVRLRNLGQLSAYEFVSLVWGLAPIKRLQELAAGTSEVALAANRDLDSIVELFAVAVRFDQQMGSGAREFVQEIMLAPVAQDSLATVASRQAVVLATPSQLAGRQFELVALPRLQEGIWPNLKPRNSMLAAAGLQAYLLGRTDNPLGPTRAELADELRLFYKSLGVTRSKLILSAMEATDEQPSQFLQMAGVQAIRPEIDIEFEPRKLVGKLRADLVRGDASAAPVLAALALVGAPGAHPSNWQGLLDISSNEQVVSEAESLRLSASRLDAFEACPLHWFIHAFGGDGSSFEASIGTLLHAAMEVSLNASQLTEYVDSNWHTLKFDADWLSRSAHRRATKMLGLMAEYLNQSGELVASEQGFELQVGRLVVAGKIDRVERTEAGLIAADLKTGKPPSVQDVPGHRQLALYQLGLRELYDEKVVGGRIISVGSGSLKVLDQPELGGDTESAIRKLLARAESEIGQSEFVAEVSEHCQGDAKCQLLLARAVTDA